MEPEPGVVRHEPVREAAEALRARGFKLKGHPLVWTYSPCLPPHRQDMDFGECMRVFRERIRRDVPPFAELIDVWDIINEAHDTFWANSLALTSGQMVELTAMAAEETRRAAPGARLVVNICLPFGEYVAGAPGRVTPLEYVRACIEAGVDFDVIGIQFYYGGGQAQYCWDMLEVSRILDEFAALGKELHITELGTPSAMGPDPDAMIKEGNAVGVWHGDWTQETQADWVEQFYRIAISKPRMSAITWWSFSDAGGHFWTHGGLLDREDEPKLAFHRLVALREEIRSE
jgi:GH35 family endo-1,4-beta-xylanase